MVKYEGFVVVDKDYHRIKIESPDYLAIHHNFEDKLSKKKILEVIKENEVEEILTYFPNSRDRILEYQSKYEALIIEISQYCDYAKSLYEEINDRKKFANLIKKDKYNAFAFSVLFNGKSIEEILKMMPNKNFEKLLEQTDKNKEQKIDFAR
jgi:hypothetical protein